MRQKWNKSIPHTLIVKGAGTSRMGFTFALCLCLISAMLGIQKNAAADRIVELTNGAAEPGTSTTISLRMDQLQDFAGGDFEILYNPDLISIVDVTRTEYTDNFFIVEGNPSPGLLTISMASTEGLPAAANGDIASIELQVYSTTQSGTIIPLTFQTARWYDENSVRQGFIGDNGFIAAGGSIPPEEPLEISAGSVQGQVSSVVEIPLILSIAEGTASVALDIEYDKSLLINPAVTSGDLPSGWQMNNTVEEGHIGLSITGDENLPGVAPVVVANCSFSIADSATVGSTIALMLSQAQVKNSNDFGFYTLVTDGSVLVQQGQVTPTPLPTGSPADFNGDGKVDKDDLLQFISTWHEEATQ